MKKQIVTALLMGILAAFTITGCSLPGQKAEEVVPTEAPTATPEPTNTPAPTATPTPVPLKIIGESVEGAYKVYLTNMTGKAIKGIAVRKETDLEFPDSLMEEEDLFEAREERILYYRDELQDGQIADAEYEIMLTFEDDTTAVLHKFPFKDMEEGKICLDDEIAYLTYTSIVTKAPVNTKASEIMAFAGVDPTAAPTAVITATPVPTQTVQTTGQTGNTQTGSSTNNSQYTYTPSVPSTPSYDDDDNTGGNTDENDDRVFYEQPDDNSGNTAAGDNTNGGNTGGDVTGGDNTGGDYGGDDEGGDRVVYD
jgi:colicin import membrane protein